MKQLVILSGKGGTGKTIVTAAFAHLASQGQLAGKVILADADVDAANLELMLQPRLLEQQDFKGGKTALIDQGTCISCGDCQAVCRFDAINLIAKLYVIDPIACDGCAACVYQCPSDSITMHEQVAGKFYFSECAHEYGPLYHANLLPGRDNSGKLVTLVKQRARQQAMSENYELIIVDGPPGIGCPVISSVSGASLALIVTEPSLAGVHDMHRILQTVQHFGVRTLVCINKADIYPAGADEIEAFCRNEGIEIIGRIPFDQTVSRAMVAGEAVTAYRPEAAASIAIAKTWEHVLPSLLESI